jgi:hypothetical protein
MPLFKKDILFNKKCVVTPTNERYNNTFLNDIKKITSIDDVQ